MFVELKQKIHSDMTQLFQLPSYCQQLNHKNLNTMISICGKVKLYSDDTNFTQHRSKKTTELEKESRIIELEI